MSSDDYAELLTNAGEAGIFTRPADGDALDDAAERAGMARWSVDLSGVRAKAALLDAIAKQLELPDWFGGNWDALNDSLTDLAWNHPAGVVLTLWRCDAIAQADPQTFETALEVLDAVAESCYDEDIPFWVFVDGIASEQFDLPALDDD